MSGKRQVAPMHRIHLGQQIGFVRAVVDDVVRMRESLAAGSLGRYDGPNLLLVQPAAALDALDLDLLRAVDDKNAVHTRPPAAGLYQKRNDEQRVGGGELGDKPGRSFADQGMEDGLKLASGISVLEGQLPHRCAIERAFGVEEACTKALAYCRNGRAVRGSQFTRDIVGVDHACAALFEQPHDGGLTAADSSSDADNEGRAHMNRR